ncbi:hypothetical protein [Deinococcus petrolearius]|uniref:Uncharacterized protein n=1 Tax=Deinococcus petrolearius TaxID=1751295 RepID=A0ABW1DPE0_9DEIO
MHVILTTHSDTGDCFHYFYGANNPTDLGEELARAEESCFDAERGDRTLLRTHDLIVTHRGDGGVVSHHLRPVNRSDFGAAVVPMLRALAAHGLDPIEVEDVGGGEWHVRRAPRLAVRDVDNREAQRTLCAHTVPQELVRPWSWEPGRGTVGAATLAQNLTGRWISALEGGGWVNPPAHLTDEDHALVAGG